MIGKILVGLGGKAAEGGCCNWAATQLAISIAERHSASLTGVTVADIARLHRLGPMPIGASAVAAEMREQRITDTRDRVAESVHEFEQACASAGLSCESYSEEQQTPFECLISRARYHDITLVGLHGMFEFGVHGEAHHDPASILTRLVQGGVRPLIATPEETRPIERVLIAYSGSCGSAKTMRRYVQMRLWPDAQVRVLTCGGDYRQGEQNLADAREYCASHGIEVETDYRPGSPQHGVLDAASDWGADMIVMGNSHRTLLTRNILGDTMFETAHHADVPLFLSQ